MKLKDSLSKQTYDKSKQHVKKQRHHFAHKGLCSQSYGFPVVTYGCETWTIKKAESQRIDVFKLWCWRRLLRVPWTTRRSNQTIPKKFNPEYSLEGLMLKLQFFGHLMQSGEGDGNPLQYSCLENPMDGGAWWATVHGVAKSRTRWSDFTHFTH